VIVSWQQPHNGTYACNVTTALTLYPPKAAISEPPLGKNAQGRPCQRNQVCRQAISPAKPSSIEQRLCANPSLFKPSPNPAHDCGSVYGAFFAVKSGRNGALLLSVTIEQ